MLKIILKTINRYNMFRTGDCVVVAVSGGPDSVVLLHILKRLEPVFSLKLCVAHLDHNLRKNSSKDREFVKRMAEGLGFRFFSKTIEWRGRKPKGSVEEALRLLRYDFLISIAKKEKADSIALGHTMDDQAETVLMRILRGSGLYGLSSILAVRQERGITLVRPLIGIPRKDVLKFLSEENIRYVTDESNSDEKFFRNKIRKNLLPLLERSYNANIKELLSNIALTVGADYDLLAKQARAFIDKDLKIKNGVFCLARVPLACLDVSLRRIVYRDMIASIHGNLRRISYKHIEELEELVFSKPVSAQVHLPFGVVVLKTEKSINFLKR